MNESKVPGVCTCPGNIEGFPPLNCKCGATRSKKADPQSPFKHPAYVAEAARQAGEWATEENIQRFPRTAAIHIEWLVRMLHRSMGVTADVTTEEQQ